MIEEKKSKIVNNERELYAAMNTQRVLGKKLIPHVDDLIINFDIQLPLDKVKLKKKFPTWNNQDIIFNKCLFPHVITFRNNHYNFFFWDCKFNEIEADDVTLEGKMRFRECQFKKMLSLNNTSFKGLADFWQSTFYEKVVFHKVDFEKTVVFSGSNFKDNVLFTYTLFAKQGIFRGAICEKGFDISLSIIEGNLSVFDFKLNNYSAVSRELRKLEYESLVHEIGDIPIKNKRETFRILKKHYENSSNVPESLRYRVREKITLLKETFYELIRFSKIQHESIGLSNIIKLKFKAFFNLFVLSANYLSNHFGVAYIQSFLFTLFVGAIGYYLTILNTEKYVFDWSFELSILKENIPGYANFLIPTHKFNFLGEDFYNNYKISNWFYVFDIAGRMAIGYGIYQTVQAFRKFR